MTGKHNIFLIGPMGSGKTAVGKYLARVLDYPFLDSDHEIEQRTGADIPLIFEREGEAGFRQREREVIAELSARARIVLATGGGAVLDAADAPRSAGSAAGWCISRPRWRSRPSAPGARGIGRCCTAPIRRCGWASCCACASRCTARSPI